MSITRFQNRRGTAAEWTAENSVLADGEIGFETDTKKWKFGDGATAWNSLAYQSDVTYSELNRQTSFMVFPAFEVTAANNIMSTVGTSSSSPPGAYLAGDGNASGQSATFLLRAPLQGGTWSLRMAHQTGLVFGIAAFATSVDGSSFTDISGGTIDTYANPAVNFVRSLLTGLVVPDGTQYLRVTSNTKHASSTGYLLRLLSLAGTRTGA